MSANDAKLFYLVGPSGAGKDTLLTALARQPRTAPALRIARRCITRARHPGDEDHAELPADEFARRDAAGEFLFAWQSHGFSYGVERRVLDWLDAGDDVIVNGSRAYLDNALAICPQMLPVWISVPERVLRERLEERGRESPAQIAARIRRNRELEERFRSRYVRIRNDGSIADLLARFDALRRRGR